MEKILSIIVASYNMEAYLPKCLGSLVIDDRDLLQKLDVIVVNDGSKDRTSDIAHEFEANYPGVFRVIDKENGNYGSCINCGLIEANGIYVKTIDADDWVDNYNFKKYMGFIWAICNSEERPDLILNDFDFVNNEGVAYRHQSYSFVNEPDFTVSGFTYENNRALWMHAIAYKTENLRKIHYQQMEGLSYTDEEWLSQPMTTVTTLKYFPAVVYNYLMGRQGQTCDQSTYFRNYWMIVKILVKMLSSYSVQIGQLPKANNEYMLNHLQYRVRSAYTYMLLNRNVKIDNDAILEFDSFLKMTVPELYLRSDSYSVRCRLFRFHFVHYWRSTHDKKALRFKLYQLYLLITSTIGKIRMRRRT